MIGSTKFYAPIVGAWRKGGFTDDAINITGSKAIIHSGSFSSAVGANARLTEGGTIHISGAEVEMTGGTFNLNINDPEQAQGVIGGLAVVRSSPTATRAEATVTASKVKITGGSFNTPGNPITIAGGYVDINSNKTIKISLTENTADVTANSIKKAYGAYAGIKKHYGGSEVTAERNAVKVTKFTDAADTIAGASITYHNVLSSEISIGSVTLTARENSAALVEGTVSTLYGAEFSSQTRGGKQRYEATGNAVTVGARGRVTHNVIGAYIASKTTERVSFYDVTASKNTVTGTGGTYAGGMFGGRVELSGEGGWTRATLTQNRIDLTDAALDGSWIRAGAGVIETKAARQDASATANGNIAHLRNISGTVRNIFGGHADARAEKAGAEAEANANEVTLESGTLTKAYHVYGGGAWAEGVNAPATATASGNTVTLSAAAPWEFVYGGRIDAIATNARATGEASHNTVNITAGTYRAVYGGYADPGSNVAGSSMATANGNILNISGGTYQKAVYAAPGSGGTAEVKDNQIVITGTPDLRAAELYGGYVKQGTRNVSGNALVIKETKGLSVKSIADFQKLDFWIPAGMTNADTMLTVTATTPTNLDGAAVTAHLRGDETATRLRLLRTENATITKNASTTLTVWKGVSDATTAKISITGDSKEIIVEPPPPTPGGGGTTPGRRRHHTGRRGHNPRAAAAPHRAAVARHRAAVVRRLPLHSRFWTAANPSSRPWRVLPPSLARVRI